MGREKEEEEEEDKEERGYMLHTKMSRASLAAPSDRRAGPACGSSVHANAWSMAAASAADTGGR